MARRGPSTAWVLWFLRKQRRIKQQPQPSTALPGYACSSARRATRTVHPQLQTTKIAYRGTVPQYRAAGKSGPNTGARCPSTKPQTTLPLAPHIRNNFVCDRLHPKAASRDSKHNVAERCPSIMGVLCFFECKGEQTRKTQDELQWIVAQRLLSALTIPGFK